MKKLILWGLLATIIVGCSNDEMTEIVEMKQTGIAVTAGLTSNTRINFEQDGDVVYAHWDSDDQITLYADSQGGLDYQVSSVDDAGTTASFSAVKDVLQNTDEVIYATYPATMITDGVATLPITSVWSDTRDMSFAYAVGNVADGKVDLQFKHLYAYLKLTLNAETVSGIDTNEISGLWITNSSGDWISTNSGTYDFNTQTYTFTEGTNCMVIEFEETFVADGDAEKVVYIPIIPLGSGNTINLSVLHEHETGCDTLHIIGKDTPETGFEAGKVYTYSLAAPFTKEGNSITLKVAGTLSQAISAEAKDTITSLKISGPLNGDDIRFIREMAGRDVSGNETEGKLVDLDLSEAEIVTGGGAYYEDYTITGNDVLGTNMFASMNFETIILPIGVTLIENYAFQNCSSLASITIPDGVISIGAYSFQGCSALTSVTIPNSIRSINSYLFEGCTSLTSITIPDGVTWIEMSAFEGCTSMTSAVIPDGVTSIGPEAFKGCSLLEKVEISSQSALTSIGGSAFEECSFLASITIPDGVTSIGNAAFSGCNSLKNVTISSFSALNLIESYAFRDCTSLTSIVIPDGVTAIGDHAFQGCISLFSITIPEGITSIESQVFNDCSSLSSITIPNSVTSIGGDAFAGCASLTSISIPDGVTSIGWGAFTFCTSLTSVILGNGLTSIDTASFHGCSSLTAITIPDGVTSIGTQAFYKCSSLAEVTCEAINPPVLETSVFTQIASPSTLIVPSGCTTAYGASDWAQYFTTIDDGEEHGSYENGVATVVTAGTLSTLIPEDEKYTITTLKVVGPLNGYDIRFIREMAGRDVSGNETEGKLVDLDMSEASIVEGGGDYYEDYNTQNNIIGENMFELTTLKSIKLPMNITKIGWFAFSGCSSLLEVNIPIGVTEIGISAFSQCSLLEGIVMGDSVMTIGDGTFAFCSSLTSINIPDGITSIGASTFRKCSSLTSISIPDAVTSIGDEAFYGCSSLTSINIPNGVTTIGIRAFKECN